MVASGLEGVNVAETELSMVDGEKGQLIIRGYDVEEIAGHITFEQLCGLLWHDSVFLPVDLGPHRQQAFRQLDKLGDALGAANGMDALRASLAHLDQNTSMEDVAAAAAVFAAAWCRLRNGLSPVAPRPELTHAHDFLRMATGNNDEVLAAGLEAYLVTVSDHGMNASTFACRVVASTGSDLVSGCVAGVGALKGPLHGGAPGPVLDMLDAVGSTANAEAWIDAELAAGRRIMGMGHRIYRVRDPRAAVLEKAIDRLETSGIRSTRLSLARAVEKIAQGKLAAKYPDRPLAANVEFYTAVLLDTIGLPRELFSSVFAGGRIAGWCAHFREQGQTGRLIRPNAEYVGPKNLKVDLQVRNSPSARS